MAPPNPHHAPLARGALHSPTPKVRAQCASCARWDPCGGRPDPKRAKGRSYRDPYAWPGSQQPDVLTPSDNSFGAYGNFAGAQKLHSDLGVRCQSPPSPPIGSP